ncbi:MAG TPA: hypothetical protein VGO47_02025 [Chlamydiales bacterium]|nr:hypothetical protein [Chlamydiales bacterium]
MARMEARKAVEVSRKADIAKTVQDDAKVRTSIKYTRITAKLACQSLLAFVESNFKRAERDNDLIYHQDVPSATSLPKIGDIKDVVHSTVPPGLEDPKAYLNGGIMIFSELSAWGVRVAVGKNYVFQSRPGSYSIRGWLDIYKERKKDWVQLEIFDKARQLDSETASLVFWLLYFLSSF